MMIYCWMKKIIKLIIMRMMINTEVIIIEIIFNLMILIIKTRITISSRTGEIIHNIIINNRENKLIIKILKLNIKII